MRICLFTATFLPKIGGHEMAVDELARQYQQLGHETVVLAQHASRRGTPQHPEFPYRVIRFAKPFSQYWGVPRLRRALRQLHREWPYDIIHSFSSYPTGFAALDPGKEFRVPVVITSQGGDLAENSRFLARPSIRKRIEQTLAQAGAVVAISAYMKKQALSLCPPCASRLHEIPNGVNCPFFRQSLPGTTLVGERIGAKTQFFLFLGRFHPRKGVDVLIEAFRQAAPSLPETALVLAGDGNAMADLRAQASRSGVSDRIHFPGMVEGQDKLWLLQNALCLVSPTRTWEGLPVVVLEAMASGLPVIGTQVGGIVDLVVPCETGLLVPPENAPELAAALRRMAEQPEERAAMGREAQAKAQAYDWERLARQYISLFRGLTRQRKAA